MSIGAPHSPSALALRSRPPHSPSINNLFFSLLFGCWGRALARGPALRLYNRRFSWWGLLVLVSLSLVRCALGAPLRQRRLLRWFIALTPFGCTSWSLSSSAGLRTRPPHSPSALALRTRPCSLPGKARNFHHSPDHHP